MASYYGRVENAEDAIILIEACRIGILPSVGRRLNQRERELEVRSGAIFVWREGTNAEDVARWTDGRKWSKSRIQSVFLLYNERLPKEPQPERLNSAPLIKKAVSVTLKNGDKYRLVSYFCDSDIPKLSTPRADPNLNGIPIQRQLYPKMSRNVLYGKTKKKSKNKWHEEDSPEMSSESFSEESDQDLIRDAADFQQTSVNYPAAAATTDHLSYKNSGQRIAVLERSLGSSYLNSLNVPATANRLVHHHSIPNYQAVTDTRNSLQHGSQEAQPSPLRRTDIKFLLN